MAGDFKLSERVRAFAGWEVEYREAAGILVDFDLEGELRRTEYNPGRDGDRRDLEARKYREDAERARRRQKHVAELKRRTWRDIPESKLAPLAAPAESGI